MTTPSHPPLPSLSSPTLYQPNETQHLYYLNQTISLAKLSPPKPSNFRVGCVIVSYPELVPTKSLPEQHEKVAEGEIISTGFTLELEGNTHAEQNALTKLFSSNSNSSLQNTLEKGTERKLETETREYKNVYLYTSLEPCSLRLSGNKSCVNRIIDLNKHTTTTTSGPQNKTKIKLQIQKIIFGAKEPSTFVKESQSCKLLDSAGVKWEYIPELEDEILSVAMEGHSSTKESAAAETTTTGVEGMSTLHARVDAMAANGGMTKKTDVKHETEIEEEERRKQEEERESQPRNPKKRMMELS